MTSVSSDGLNPFSFFSEHQSKALGEGMGGEEKKEVPSPSGLFRHPFGKPPPPPLSQAEARRQTYHSKRAEEGRVTCAKESLCSGLKLRREQALFKRGQE